ncbi:MAG: acyl-CoA desaturase [Planctomycetota bacterium]
MIQNASKSLWAKAVHPVVQWFDTWSERPDMERRAEDPVDWVRVIPFFLLHMACFAVIWVGWSWFAVGMCVAMYAIRMFAITGFYHRYFSHKSFRTSRPMQFVMAVLGNISGQRGPLWWSAHHRHHHKASDEADDVHSPVSNTLWWSHVGWILAPRNFPTHKHLVPDWMKFPELRFLDRFDMLMPTALGFGTFFLGMALEAWAPSLGTNGWQLLVWGFVISTIALYHGTFTINSLAHRWGKRRFETSDHSRNNLWLALITGGEGWHNNHHHYPNSVRQGFYWWEIDMTYYTLWVMSKLGLVWDLKPVPTHALTKGHVE